MRLGRRHAVLAVALVVGASACASLLGVEEVGYSADAGAEGSVPGDAPLGESAPPDDGADGACTQMDTDPNNCGRCGHSCLGGTCLKGTCQPVVVASGERGCTANGCQTNLVADDEAVYWVVYDVHYLDAGNDVNPGHVAKAQCDGGGCGPKEVLVPDVYRGGAISLDTTHVYFASGVYAGAGASQIYRCQKNGCAETPGALCGPTTVISTTVHAGQIYWTDDLAAGSVFTSSTAGCDGGVPPIANIASYTVDVLVDDAFIFVTTGDRVARSPVSGVTLVPISPQSAGLYRLALDAQYVYWTLGASGGGVYKCGRAANCSIASPGPVALSQSSPGPIVVDPSGLYWINLVDPPVDGGFESTIVHCAGPDCLDGGPSVLASGQNKTSAIAVNKDSVFWANWGDGTIMRLAKP